MHIIVCADEAMGMAFCRRRQSMDRVLRRDLLELVGDAPLWLTNYTAGQFDALPTNARVVSELPGEAGPGDYVFLELAGPQGWEAQVEDVILYRWNRLYLSDTRFPQALLDCRTLAQSREFAGSSHDLITREVYRHG